MSLQRIRDIFFGSVFCLCAGNVEAQISPKFSAQLWADAHYEDRFGDQTMGFDVRRAVLTVEVDLDPVWSAQFSYLASLNATARLQEGFLQYAPGKYSDLQVQFGRVKIPYYDYTEESFDNRWALMLSQAESVSLISHRDDGVRAQFAAADTVRVALMLRNAATSADADLGWNASLAWKPAPEFQWQLMLDQQTLSASPARTTVLVSMGARNNVTAGLLELNYQSVDNGSGATSDGVGFSLMGQYSVERTLDAETDRGVLASIRTGSKDYRSAAREQLKLSLGGYRKLSSKLRTAVQGILHQGVDSTADSDGIAFFWTWEAKF